MSATRKLNATIASALLTLNVVGSGCLPDNFYVDLAGSSIEQIVDASLSAAIDCLLSGDSTSDASADTTGDTSGS